MPNDKPCELHYVRSCPICAKSVRKADENRSQETPVAEIAAPTVELTDPLARDVVKLSTDYAEAVEAAASAQLEVQSLEKLLASARESLKTAEQNRESARQGLFAAVVPQSAVAQPNQEKV